MSDPEADRPFNSTCPECGQNIAVVTKWTGDKVRINKRRVTIINKIKDDIWTSTSGYIPHADTCQKKGAET